MRGRAKHFQATLPHGNGEYPLETSACQLSVAINKVFTKSRPLVPPLVDEISVSPGANGNGKSRNIDPAAETNQIIEKTKSNPPFLFPQTKTLIPNIRTSEVLD